MGRSSFTYRPKAPAQGVLYQVVRDHLETFRAEAARVDGRDGLPRFVEEEFRGFLRCGFLAGGFARFRCAGCRLDRLVPFSCKGRAVCPSCGGRRMAERAAHLVDHVFPLAPVRQWVLSLPPRLRYVLAWDHALCRAVAGVFVTIDRRVHRLLARRGVLDDLAADRWREEAPVLAGIAAASVQGRRALGARAGAAVRRQGASAELLALAPSGRGPCHARWNGFDLHAAVVVPPRDRARLERLCRYALRPPVAQERIHLTPGGQVVLDLRHRWADGTTRLVFDPIELLERLAALTPRPRINLLLYYGVLGARSAWRARIAGPEVKRSAETTGTPAAPRVAAPVRARENRLWAALM